MSDADDRFASIAGGGLKKRRATISVVPEPSEPEEERVAESAPEKKKAAARADGVNSIEVKPSAGERARPKSADIGGTRRAAFRMPEQIDAKLRDRVRADGTSKVHVMLDAIEHVVANETQLDFSAHTPVPTKSALFTRPRATAGATPSVQAEVTLDAESLGTIDKLAAKYGAPTRTAFVLACLGEYL